MTNFAARIAGLATLALAALPMAAIATASHAATATVQVADLNLNTEAGLATFQQRAAAATQTFCRTNGANRSLATQSACVKGVRMEVSEKLASARQAQFAARTTTIAAR
jgi:UrcA family protein